MLDAEEAFEPGIWSGVGNDTGQDGAGFRAPRLARTEQGPYVEGCDGKATPDYVGAASSRDAGETKHIQMPGEARSVRRGIATLSPPAGG